mmetsp:Transcript_16068/g.36762  ORF Transcript_16068/g.36762 Transcript_16068/m.36762 type:complete len:486 (+) Transcript_16068:98-1555(+)
MPIDYSKWDNVGASSDEGSASHSEDDGLTTFGESGGGINMGFDRNDALGPAFVPPGASKAERELIRRGVDYEWEGNWIRTGVRKNIIVHPDDDCESYSPVIFTEDPETFVPDPAKFDDGRVRKFGLYDPPSLAQDDMMAFMSRTMGASSKQFMYCDFMRSKDQPRSDKPGELPDVQFMELLMKRKDEYISSPEVEARLHSTYVIKIELVECEKYVWRRVRVPSGIDLPKFHDQVIVPVMGWSRAYHGYVFEDPVDGTQVGPVKNSGYIDMMHVGMHFGKLMEDTGYPLAAMLKKEGDAIYYLYDLGDGWRHRIVLEEVVPEEEDVTLVDGAGGCPPEDSNGLEDKGCGGYAELLEMVRRGSNKAKVKATLKEVSRTAINYSKPWAGGPPLPFRPLEYNLNYHRSLLNMIVTGPSVKKIRTHPVEGECFKESMRECSNCGSRLKTLSRCLGCKKVWYCSRDCQVANWKEHKIECKAAQKKSKTKKK